MADQGFNSIGILILLLSHIIIAHSSSVVEWDSALFRQMPTVALTPALRAEYRAQSLSCEELSGTGSLDTVCTLSQANISFAQVDTVLVGNGTLEIQANVWIACVTFGCSVTILLGGDVNLGANSTLRSSSLWIQAANVNIGDNASLDSSAFHTIFFVAFLHFERLCS